MRKRRLFERFIAFVLAFALSVPTYFGNGVFAHAAEVKPERDSGASAMAMNKDSPIALSLEWAESEFKNESDLNIVEDTSISNTVKLKVSYSSEKVSENGYKPGDLIITVKGIGGVNRSSTLEATVGADKQTAEVKNRDWSYTWNKASDTYTFTNNNDIKPNSVMSGYFEMAWTSKSRDSVHEYVQDNIMATMILPDGKKVYSNALFFSNETFCDEYTVDIERAVLYSSNGVSNSSYSSDEYVFVKYTIASHKETKSRGASEEQFIFTDLVGDIAGVGEVTYANIPYTATVYNGVRAYRLTLKNNETANSQYIVVAYPKGCVGVETKAIASTLARFYEGDNSGNMGLNMVAQDSVEFTMPADFGFVDDGGIFHIAKNSYYEYMELTDYSFASKVTKNGGHMPGSKMQLGATEQFYLGFSMKGYTGSLGTFAFELIDDFFYITQNNGDYRQLDPADYEFKQIVIPSTKTLLNENGVAIQSGAYPVRVYAVQNGEKIETDEYELTASITDEPYLYSEEESELVFDESVEGSIVYTDHKEIPMRTIPAKGGEISCMLEAGTPLFRYAIITNPSGTKAWSIVETPDGNVGYIYNGFLRSVSGEGIRMPNSLGNFVEPNDTVYLLFDAPAFNTSNEMIFLERGAAYKRLAEYESSGWSVIEDAQGNMFLIYSGYLQIDPVEEPIDSTRKTPDSENLVWKGLWMDYDQTIDLPEGTTAIAIRYEGLSESVWADYQEPVLGKNVACKQPAAIVTVEFHLNEKDWESEKQFNLTDGQVVNTMAVNLYGDDGSMLKNNITEDNYLDDDINIDLAQKDLDTYGRYMNRARGAITFYGSERSDYKAYTSIANIKRNGNRYTTNLTIGADFAFKESEIPDKFSLYTILPEKMLLDGYRVQEDIWDNMTISGMGMSEEVLAKHCTPEIINDYKGSGRTYIALHFDFAGNSVPQDGNVRASFEVKIDKKFFRSTSSTVNIRSVVLLNKECNVYDMGKDKDNGWWDVDASLSKDIDRDGDAEEHLSCRYGWATYTYVDSSELQLTKSIKTSATDDFVQMPTIPFAEYGLDYIYEVSLRNGNSTSKNIVVIDALEAGSNSRWKGSFKSVDLSEAEKFGLTGKVYYSNKTDPGALGGPDWSDSMDPVAVKAVAIDFGDSELKAGGELNIYIHMTAPSDETLNGKVTENGFHASFVMLDAATGNETKYDSLESNFVQAKLAPPLYTVILTKIDKESYARLSQAKFSLVDKATGEVFASGVTNAIGQIVFKGVPSGGSYCIREDEAPYGYEPIDDIDIVFDQDGKTKYITIADPRKSGCIEVCKTNSLDPNMPVPDAEYALFDVRGLDWFDASNSEINGYTLTGEQWTELESRMCGTAITDSNGVAVFTDLPWSEYAVIEWRTAYGYQPNPTFYAAEVNRETVSDPIVIDTADVQNDVSVNLVKYEMTSTGEETYNRISGVTFELVRLVGEEWKRVGLYVTDENGEIYLEELPYGFYAFREYRIPLGYTKAEDEFFILDPYERNAYMTVFNQRKPGSIVIAKTDNLGNFVQGAEFTLCDEYKNELFRVVTDEFGSARIDNVEWGTYFLKEISAPMGYVLNEEWKEVVIGAESLSVTVNCVNETVKGSVRITKTDETEQIFLGGAEFTLYTADGSVVGVYITDDAGHLLVEGLEWGSYYFKETKAPVGYGLAPDTIRFSINSVSAGTTQELHVVDPKDAKYISVVKRIRADEVNSANGDPAFVIKVEGTDVNGIVHTYHQIVTFDEKYIRKNTDTDGYVSQEIIFTDLTAGSYTVSVIEPSRYVLESITDVVNGVIQGEIVTLDVENTSNAGATFTSRTYEHQDYSDNGSVLNILKKQASYTSLKVDYKNKDVEAQSDIDLNLLSVYAVYDDGTTIEVPAENCVLSASRFPNQNGECITMVTYTEGGISRTASFAVNVYGQVPVVLSMTAESARVVKAGGAIRPEYFEVTATYNDGTTGILLPEQYMVSPSVAPSHEGDIEVAVELNLDVVRNEERAVSTTVTVTVQDYPVLIDGPSLNAKIPSTTTRVTFTDEVAPNGVTLTDVSVAKDNSIVLWQDGTRIYISSQIPGMMIAANADSSDMFKKTDVSYVDGEMLDTSGVTDMSYMFYYCYDLVSLEGISSWNVSNVINMEYTFSTAPNIKNFEAIRNWDTSSVTTMKAMFYNCSWLTDLELISGWNVSNVTNMENMFGYIRRLTHLEGIANWDVSSVTNMCDMFSVCDGLVDISAIRGWDVSNVTNMQSMFHGTSITSTAALKDWDMSSVTNMQEMFYSCFDLVSLEGIGNWDVSNVKNMTATFGDCNYLTDIGEIGKWDTSSVTNMRSMFYRCNKATSFDGIGMWDTSNVTDMSNMFKNCGSITNLDLTEWDTSKVSDMSEMFLNCKSLKHICVSDLWNKESVTASTDMFTGCVSLVGSSGTVFNESYTDQTYAKVDGGESNPGYLTMRVQVEYDSIAIGDTSFPTVKISDGFVVTSYEVVSGAEYISFNKETGAATGVQGGRAVVKITVKNADGKVYSDLGAVDVLQPTEVTIDNQCADIVTVVTEDPVVHANLTEFKLVPVGANQLVLSFEMNGETVSGDTFVAPASGGSVVITNAKILQTYVIESEHNPYPGSMYGTVSGINGKIYGEVHCEGATSLTVELDYQMDGVYDYISLYDENKNLIGGKDYGSKVRKKVTIVVDGDYVMIAFCTNSLSNDWYGFRAVVIPNYE